MAYAIDIINQAFNKTKEMFFPIKLGYWLRMGFVNLFSGPSSGSSSSSSNYSGRDSDFSKVDFRQALANLNQEGLNFFSQYGFLTTIGIFVLYLISLFFSYLNSVLTFVFIDGVFNKNFRIRKSFGRQHKLGVSFFALKFILGILHTLFVLLLFSPLLLSFFANDLVNFNFWLMVPILIILVLVGIVLSFFLFLVYDFVLPIMYLKRYAFAPAWRYFLKIARKNKLEIFIYWLFKIVLGLGTSIILLISLIPVGIVLGIIAIPFVAVGVGIYYLFKSAGEIVMYSSLGIYGTFVFFFFIYLLSVIYVPISAFFVRYSIEMLGKLEGK